MSIKPWDRDIQPIGEGFDVHWNACDRRFVAIFSGGEDDSESLPDERLRFNVWLLNNLIRSARLSRDTVNRYFEETDSVIQDLLNIARSLRVDSFDSQEEESWFISTLLNTISNLPQVNSLINSLIASATFDRADQDAFYAFMSFHSKLKELSKYCLLRMDIKRAQRKLADRALYRINKVLWESLKSSGRTPIREFLAQCKYRLEYLDQLSNVSRVNYRLEEGIVLADKAYNPQTYLPNTKRNIYNINSLCVDLGDNDIITGSFSLDRNLEGFVATDSSVSESPLIIAFKGTDVTNMSDIKTDFVQALTCANDVYLEALGLLLWIRDIEGRARTVRVYGHSLGGGLMQFAVSASPSGRIFGYGYNSAGLSNGTMSLIPQPMHIDKIRHFRVRKDCVMATGEQLGVIEQYEHPVCNWFTAHKCDKIRNALNKDNEFVNII